MIAGVAMLIGVSDPARFATGVADALEVATQTKRTTSRAQSAVGRRCLVAAGPIRTIPLVDSSRRAAGGDSQSRARGGRSPQKSGFAARETAASCESRAAPAAA